MFGRNLAYTLAYKYSRPRLMSWHAVSGSIRSLQGTYEFIPAGPSRTKVGTLIFREFRLADSQ